MKNIILISTYIYFLFTSHVVHPMDCEAPREKAPCLCVRRVSADAQIQRVDLRGECSGTFEFTKGPDERAVALFLWAMPGYRARVLWSALQSASKKKSVSRVIVRPIGDQAQEMVKFYKKQGFTEASDGTLAFDLKRLKRSERG